MLKLKLAIDVDKIEQGHYCQKVKLAVYVDKIEH